MSNIKIEMGKDFLGNDTEEMFLDKEGLYTIEDLIELLQVAKHRWGNRNIVIWNTNENIIGGFGSVCINEEDGNICIIE